MTLKYDYVQVSVFVHLENVCSKQIMKRSCLFKITHARCNVSLILHFSIHVCMYINKLSMLFFRNGSHVICICAVRAINLIAIRSFKYVLCTCVLFRAIHLCAISYFVPVNYSCCLSVYSFVLLTCSFFVLFTCRYSCFFHLCVMLRYSHVCYFYFLSVHYLFYSPVLLRYLCYLCYLHACFCAICAIYLCAISWATTPTLMKSPFSPTMEDDWPCVSHILFMYAKPVTNNPSPTHRSKIVWKMALMHWPSRYYEIIQ